MGGDPVLVERRRLHRAVGIDHAGVAGDELHGAVGLEPADELGELVRVPAVVLVGEGDVAHRRRHERQRSLEVAVEADPLGVLDEHEAGVVSEHACGCRASALGCGPVVADDAGPRRVGLGANGLDLLLEQSAGGSNVAMAMATCGAPASSTRVAGEGPDGQLDRARRARPRRCRARLSTSSVPVAGAGPTNPDWRKPLRRALAERRGVASKRSNTSSRSMSMAIGRRRRHPPQPGTRRG